MLQFKSIHSLNGNRIDEFLLKPCIRKSNSSIAIILATLKPAKQLLLSGEFIVQSVDKQNLVEATRAGKEVVTALINEVSDDRGLVDIVAVALADSAEIGNSRRNELSMTVFLPSNHDSIISRQTLTSSSGFAFSELQKNLKAKISNALGSGRILASSEISEQDVCMDSMMLLHD